MDNNDEIMAIKEDLIKIKFFHETALAAVEELLEHLDTTDVNYHRKSNIKNGKPLC